MANGDKISKWIGFIEKIGLPGALLIMICVGLYFGAVEPLVDVATEQLITQTRVLEGISDMTQHINAVVQSDQAERKSEAIAGVQALLERHDHETGKQLERQTQILDRLAEVVDRMEKKQ